MKTTNNVLSSNHPLITFKNVSIFYGEHKALEDIDGCLNKGEKVALLGPNGGGKSTLLKSLIGLVKPTSGKLIYQQGFSRNKIAFLPQLSEIDRSFPLKVIDAVSLGHCQRKGFFKKFSSDDQKLVMKALEEVGMADFSNRSLHALSGGQFQRVLFARVSLQKCKLILLDEPFAGVDAYTIDDLLKIIDGWQKEGCTILTISHDYDIVRSFFPISIILGRKIVAWGKTKNVLTKKNMKLAIKNLRQDTGFLDKEIGEPS